MLPSAADLAVEGTLAVPGATTELAHQLARLAPFGAGNEEPILVLQRARVVRADRVGREGTAIRAFVEGEGGGPRLKAMLFRARDGALAEALLGRQRDAAASRRPSARRGMERCGEPGLHHRRRGGGLTLRVPLRYPPPADPRALSRSSRGLGHQPFTLVTRVRIPYGTPVLSIT